MDWNLITKLKVGDTFENRRITYMIDQAGSGAGMGMTPPTRWVVLNNGDVWELNMWEESCDCVTDREEEYSDAEQDMMLASLSVLEDESVGAETHTPERNDDGSVSWVTSISLPEETKNFKLTMEEL